MNTNNTQSTRELEQERESAIKWFDNLPKEVQQQVKEMYSHGIDSETIAAVCIDESLTPSEQDLLVQNISEEESVVPETVEDISIAETLLKQHPDFIAERMSEYQNGRFNGLIEGLGYARQKSEPKIKKLSEALEKIEFALRDHHIQSYRQLSELAKEALKP